MYYTGINPLNMKKVYTPTDYNEKQMQRALLQFNRPENADNVRKALRKAGREDLIGYAPNCLVRPERQGGEYRKAASDKKSGDKKSPKRDGKGIKRDTRRPAQSPNSKGKNPSQKTTARPKKKR
jgi:hypothetical protein